ncbi:MAG: AMP-binding protein [Pseudomonadales bacterium]|nr:AMP-binding protein [Pseudomonadales bacterium]
MTLQSQLNNSASNVSGGNGVDPDSGSGGQQEPSFVSPDNLVVALQNQALRQPNQLACRFILDGNEPVAEAKYVELTYGQLYERVTQLAAALSKKLATVGGRQSAGNVLLICPPGLDFVAGFFACMQAGATVAPLQPPARKQEVARWRHIVADAMPAAVLTTAKLEVDVATLLSESLGGHHQVPVLLMDSIAVELPSNSPAKELPDINPQSVALLQYTSGSTQLPKGVKVTHANLIYNLEQIRVRFGHTPQSSGVIWLPPHHDMGLIGGILQPIYAGFPVTLMSPAAFLRRPARWLHAISHFRGTTSGGPNFAYEYCLRRCTDADLDGLDLSSWQVAFNGAESIRPSTLQAFANKFAAVGFNARAHMPCYGLAEATLLVASKQAGEENPPILEIDNDLLKQNRVKLIDDQGASDSAKTQSRLIASSGEIANGTSIAVVDPESQQALCENRVGEIWVRGPGVGAGYQNQQDNSGFHGRVDGGGENWLKTGDLGFMHRGNLFVTGRVKDLLIIRGANYAPQDIELSVEISSSRLMPSGGAAFLIEEGDQFSHISQPVADQALIVIQEVERGRWSSEEVEQTLSAIRRNVSEQHGLQVAEIILVKPASLPKTTSGKVQRKRCKNLYLQGELKVAHQWRSSALTAQLQQLPTINQLNKEPTAVNLINSKASSKADGIIAWLRSYSDQAINSQLMDERRCIAPHVLLDFGNQGLLGMQVPESMGGMGLGYSDCHNIIAQLAAIDATLGLFVGLSNVLGIRPIMNFAEPQFKQQVLPGLASGRELAAFALSEQGAGSNPMAMQATATPLGDGRWTLNGTKVWSGSAAWASYINVFVRELDAQGHITGVSCFCVPRNRQGLRQGPEALTMGMRAMVQNQVQLKDVVVTDADRLGAANQGMQVAQDAMNNGRLVIAAACVGGMKRCCQLMLRYASRRSVGSGNLLDNPLTQSRLNEICAAIDVLESLVNWLSDQLDRGVAIAEDLYVACKVLAPEWYWQACDWLVQTLGGRGYIESNLAPQMLRDARVLRIFEGPTEAMSYYLGMRTLRVAEVSTASVDHGTIKFCVSNLQLQASSENTKAELESLQARLEKNVAICQQQQKYAAVFMGELSALLVSKAVYIASAETRHAQANASRNLTWLDAKIAEVEQRRDRALAEVSVSGKPEQGSIRANLIAEIEAYRQAIGDIEQSAAGEQIGLDELLQRGYAEVNHGKGNQANRQLQTADKIDSGSATFKSQSNFPPSDFSKTKIVSWICDWLHSRLQLDSSDIDPQKAFADYGVDSVLAVELAMDIETEFKLAQPLDATIAWNYPTPVAVAELLVAMTTNQKSNQKSIQKSVHKPIADLENSVESDIDYNKSEHDSDWMQLLENELTAGSDS